MTKIFKQLARHWAVCLVVFALLFVQAYCDLALPDYTSKIVDTGIQQGGIESPLPQTLRKSTLDTLSLLMSEEDAQKLQNAYQYYLQDDGVLQLRSDLTEDERTALEDAVTTPDIVLYMAAAQAANTPAGQSSMGMTGLAEMPSAAADTDTETVTPTAADLDTVCSQFAAMSQMPGFDRSMLQKQLDSAMSQLDSTLLENLKSQSLLLVQLEYEAQGVARNVQMGYLFRVGGQMLALTLLMVVVAVAVGFLASRVSAAIGRDLRRETFSSVIGFSNAEIENFSTASLITRTTNDIQQVQFVCVILLRMVAYAPILGIGGVLHVVGSSSGLSWIVVLDVAILLLLIIFLMSVAMPKFKVMQQLVDRLNLVSREILTGIMPVRAFSREKFEEQRFDKANRELMGTQLFTNRAMVAMMPFMTLIMNGTSLLIVWFGGKAMDAGTMQVGEMIAFITYTMQIVMSFLMLAMVAVMLPRAGVAADRIDEVIRTKASIHDPDETAAKTAQAHTDWQGVVQFEDVSFRYPGADSDALEHISFTAKPGETTAIIGSTGCGKSTLLNLIPRFYDVTGGKVTVDGIDVRKMPQAQLHDLLGYVPQKGVLFSGTIESNLKFGGEDITDAQVQKAAAIAQATDFIEAKPEGYQSPIAQGGSNVSGGQKQRLSIARAIAKNPKVYLFDDSFSALDYKTDVTLRRALKAQTDNATVIIVAQRISTVLHANQILVLDEGRLVGKGTHAQLMVSCPEYQEIARSQLSQKELALDTLNTEKEGE
ncbi:ABC transporter ATP-binding protein [Faecalibacterium sp. IP-1-18]|uniref:ABC transporter ATP-binding protein n=1 Tax=Faecalibacterium sp. IP-1-18 TaxID=2929488 RepID=UPI002014C76A|nr:ABC transporter ATP-binding protein [Faecalibacterium sp. IP-1-18]UQK52915.1 ABC transporter ATP-binding protein/permease [Faecalibacterium sp. IP-1-18]